MRSSGSGRTRPLPETAYSENNAKAAAIDNVSRVRTVEPAWASRTICSPAPKYRYAGAPNKHDDDVQQGDRRGEDGSDEQQPTSHFRLPSWTG